MTTRNIETRLTNLEKASRMGEDETPIEIVRGWLVIDSAKAGTTERVGDTVYSYGHDHDEAQAAQDAYTSEQSNQIMIVGVEREAADPGRPAQRMSDRQLKQVIIDGKDLSKGAAVVDLGGTA